MLVQDTTDYARPIIFTVDTGLLDPDQGPVLDDSWPTTVKTEVSINRALYVNNINSIHISLRDVHFYLINLLIHIKHSGNTCFLQLPFWNGCDEDDHCVPDLVLQSQTDLLNRK